MNLQRSDYLELLPRQNARVEVLLSNLIERKLIRLDNTIVANWGSFTRGFLKEVVEAKPRSKSDSVYLIHTNREGLYDMLPKALFHNLELADPFNSIEKNRAETQVFDDEEKSARLFFLPIEQEFYKNRIAIEKQENELISSFQNPIRRELYGDLRLETEDINENYYDLLLFLLPLAHKISGDYELLRICLEAILNEHVTIKLIDGGINNFEKNLTPKLGEEMELGVNFICGQEVYSFVKTISIAIGPINRAELPKFINKGVKVKLLNLAVGYFLPFEFDMTYCVTIKERDRSFLLTGANGDARLGHSTILS